MKGRCAYEHQQITRVVLRGAGGGSFCWNLDFVGGAVWPHDDSAWIGGRYVVDARPSPGLSAVLCPVATGTGVCLSLWCGALCCLSASLSALSLMSSHLEGGGSMEVYWLCGASMVGLVLTFRLMRASGHAGFKLLWMGVTMIMLALEVQAFLHVWSRLHPS